MDVVQFSDQYALAAPLYEVSPGELRHRDELRGQPMFRWLAVREGVAAAAVTALPRPDGRMFLSFVGEDHPANGPLTVAASDSLRQPLFTFVAADDRRRVASLAMAGFETELVEEQFRIRFERALDLLDRAWLPSGFSIHRADHVDEDRLFTLDNTLRQDTPGTDGWRGDRSWFQQEIATSPPFDSAAYLVAIDDSNGEYAGLVRVWRNPDGPRFGLIGVLPQYRNAPIAAALLKQALAAAAGWGYDTFVAETSLTNAVVYPRMKRLGAETLGRFLQMVHH